MDSMHTHEINRCPWISMESMQSIETTNSIDILTSMGHKIHAFHRHRWNRGTRGSLESVDSIPTYPPPCLQALLASVALLSALKKSTFSISLFILFYESLFRDFSASFVAVRRSKAARTKVLSDPQNHNFVDLKMKCLQNH